METVIINVCGTKFELSFLTFHKLTKRKNSEFLRGATKISAQSYYIERSSAVFTAVVDFLVTDELHLPPTVCPHFFLSELEFWGIELNEATKCCRNILICAIEKKIILDEYDRSLSGGLKKESGKNSTCNTIWSTISDPGYSRSAKAYVTLVTIFTLISIFVIAAKTHPYFQQQMNLGDWKDYFGDEFDDIYDYYDLGQEDYYNESPNHNHSKNTTLPKNTFTYPRYLSVIDYVTMAFFTLDLLLRIIVCPNKLRFILDMINIVDTISLIAVYSHIIVELCVPNEKYKESLIDIMEAIQVLRILRFLRILQKMRVFRVLAYSLKTGYQEFILVISFFIFAAVAFGCLIYHLDGKTKISHIPDGMYWAVVTMTTVGYGDLYPVSFLGKVIAGCVAVLGSLISASLIPVFVNNFLFFYTNTNNLSLEPKLKSKSKTCVGITGITKL